MDPHEILYTLSTICGPLPATAGPAPPDTPSLGEDHWRQIEFVAAGNAGHVRQQLADLAEFQIQHRVGIGYRKVHLRPEHPVALSVTLNLPSRPLALGPDLIANGFVWQDRDDTGWSLYGQRNAAGEVIALGLSPGRRFVSSLLAAQILRLTAGGLLLVDWYQPALVDTSTPMAILDWSSSYPG